MPATTPIDPRALDSLSVAPAEQSAADEAAQADAAGDAGSDPVIDERLKARPEDVDAQLDEALDESMDASDPPAATQPGTSSDPAPSSGFDAAAEAERQQDA